MRTQWGRDWSVNASTATFNGKLEVFVSYFGPTPAPAAATFTYDVSTGAITRTR